jgi:sialidase-1
MSTIKIGDSGLVYANRKPHLYSRHAYFPSICSPQPDLLVSAMDIGTAFEAVDVRSFSCRSTDGGRTWSAPVEILPDSVTSKRISTTCRITSLPNGKLVGVASLMDRSRPDEGLANPATDGFVQTDFALVYSSDAGQSWSAPRPLNPPIDWHGFEACSPIVAMPSGRWILPTSIWPDWNGRNPHGCKAIAFVSDDAGASWRMTDVMDEWSNRIAHYEQKQALLSDGRLLAVCWTVNHASRSNLPNRYTFSSDGGDSYGRPLESPLHGETCTPLALDDNHILAIYRRTDRPGLWAHLAVIEGQRWKSLAEAPLWGSDVKAKDTSGSSLIGQMSTLRFGYPAAVRLPSGDVFVVFWGYEDAKSVIRWFKVRPEF